jgi:hypothetical protein
MNSFAPALDVANAVLYEGYLLYPYTASSPKNQMRWQFGVIVPPGSDASSRGEPSEQQTEVLLHSEGDPRIDVVARYLQAQTRQVEARSDDGFVPVPSLTVDGVEHVTFEEAVEREVPVALRPLRRTSAEAVIAVEERRAIEPLRNAAGSLVGRIVRASCALDGTVSVSAETVGDALIKIQVRIENRTPAPATERREAMLRHAFISAHAILYGRGGSFLSALDPPEFAAPASAALEQRNLWPVLAGPRNDARRAALVLASPIILYDFPEVSRQTEGDAFDATEIDELLHLSVLSLSDAERDEARATDPRARRIVERAERFGRAELSRLHDGELRRTSANPLEADPFAALDVPSLDCVYVEGIKVAKGSSVRLQPKRRADVWDSFLAGKMATVRAIHQDVEDNFYVAVTVDDDPASELHEWYGRSLFFYPEEIEPTLGAGVAG